MNPTLTSDQLNSIGQQSGYTGGQFSNTGLSSTKTVSDTSLGLTPPSQTQDASQINTQLSGNTAGTIFPPPPAAPTQGVSNNTSIAPPLPPDLQNIANQSNATTPAEQTNQSLLSRVAALIGQKQGQTGLTIASEKQAGIPALQKTVSDLSAQLEGINNQATDLQNQASPGGAIQNKEQQNILGRGVTTGGLAPLTAGDLRKNQIQQSALASRALTLKSLIYAANGNLTLAKDAADKAAQAQYEDQQNQIDYQKALIDANLPQMTKEEKTQAMIVQARLQDRQTYINQAIENKKTIIAAAAEVMKTYAGDPAAQYAAQQAIQESNNQNPDISKAFGLLYKFQTPGTTLLGQAQVPQMLQPYQKTSFDGTSYVDLSSLTPSDKATYARIAQDNGLKVIFDAQSAEKINAMSVSKENLQNIANSIQGLLGNKDIPAAQGISNSIAGFFGDDQIKAFNSWRTAIINNVQALAGGQGSGLRINQAEIDAAMKNDLPIITGVNADTPQSAAQKIVNLNKQLDAWQNQLLGSPNTGDNNPEPTNHAAGAVWIRADGTYVSDGKQWVKK